MDVIILPPHLADEPNLTAINQRLLTGEATLDWSQVKQASLEELRVLLANMDLVEHSDFLGIDSVPGDLAELVLQAIAPEVWETEPEVEQDTGNGEVSPYLCKGRSGVERGGDPRGRPGEEWRPGNEPDDGSALSSSRQPGSPILRPPSPSAIRDELERLVLLDLLGPAGGPEEEVEDSSVRDRYLVGALAPSELQTTPEEMDELAIPDDGAGEDSASDEGVMQIATLFPSSLGFSFCVDDAATSLSVTAAWGCYRREHSATLKTPKGTPRMVWKRRQMGEETRLFPLKAGPIPSWSPEPFEQPDVVVRGLMRWLDGSWTVTLFLVNEQHEPEKNRDQAWIFQPELIVEAPDGAPIFQRRDALKRNNHTDEEVAMAMLYRRHVGFAIGHGISVHAETLPGDSTRAVRLSACVVPTYDVPRTESPTPIEIPGLVGLVLDMKELAETPVEKMSRTLMPLVTVYEGWIAQQATRIDDPANDPAEYRPVALQSMQECRRTLERIRDGITLLAQKGHAAKAFAFMNEAMWQQRIHTLHAEQKRRGQHNTLEDIDKPENRSWRPFQLAFILLNLPALTDLHHPDRSADASAIADLLWFPTGGGKTEAYLGLTAFTLAIRRLQGIVEGRSGEDGVAVIMRYTLRLLTLQQFQRAAALMCACEVIRQNDPQRTWGTTPFRLGLWVGQRTTPNTTEQSEESSKQDRGVFQRGSTIGGVGSPRQLTNCPWCGSPIEAGRDIKIELYPKGRGRTFIYCGDQLGRCPFSRRNAPEGLPVLVVDEEIYRCLPSLLIATVDKFAQMPWNGNTQMLFGQVNKKCTRHGFRSPDLEDKDLHRAEGGFPHARSFPHAPLRPPDLIIQDELHLISGPLGSLVGLYETVVDGLSTWEVDGKLVRPKVVAATATIRRAAQQVHALFMRQVNVFPPQGLDVEDNFFARQREPADETPGRRYIGICASGRRLKAALIRVYVAYLSAGQYLYDKYGRAADPWMTLVGYFNSINELGGTRRLVEDDVRSRLQRMDQRGLAKRNTPFMEELTSRKSSTDIPDVLDRLEQVFDPNQQKQDGSPRRIDVLLATNMISVGVDVKRLGLMVVTGQPKTTAEYIQATSRVGRNAPGLVCVVFNWARPRDLSHYEQFEHYHATFYQQVEALSVTPFAPRALDRGLSALLVSFVRLLGPEFNANESAGIVDGTYPYFVEAFNDIYRRAVIVSDSTEVGENVRAALEDLRTYWLKSASANVGTELGYKMKKDGHTVGLLKKAGLGDWKPFTCLNSLRDVEPSINLILDERSLGDTIENDPVIVGETGDTST